MLCFARDPFKDHLDPPNPTLRTGEELKRKYRRRKVNSFIHLILKNGLYGASQIEGALHNKVRACTFPFRRAGGRSRCETLWIKASK